KGVPLEQRKSPPVVGQAFLIRRPERGLKKDLVPYGFLRNGAGPLACAGIEHGRLWGTPILKQKSS
ncbi:MAG TPA: hypothetical protein DIT07_01230, partial [Sphingobacteriaceae bacterium]|nr:hypothetical protein [Sphingobacteriaceae bacterium]